MSEMFLDRMDFPCIEKTSFLMSSLVRNIASWFFLAHFWVEPSAVSRGADDSDALAALVR